MLNLFIQSLVLLLIASIVGYGIHLARQAFVPKPSPEELLNRRLIQHGVDLSEALLKTRYDNSSFAEVMQIHDTIKAWEQHVHQVVQASLQRPPEDASPC
ncbi:hypothetical protein KIH87_11745 [Paraneptunicella aestuarii]|uniref:hypothetical protein n=1 Tax=Paraneptunicella aestuarii TaxID=2831148 RepID=UPI001E370F95|nr:hypothetical protein [Paraneptunicella aestuarii]UAA37387.1 hypothetical protein KIH87_11745 [Paraneptunicella aestuarii]